jgi:hypothetical protein
MLESVIWAAVYEYADGHEEMWYYSYRESAVYEKTHLYEIAIGLWKHRPKFKRVTRVQCKEVGV